MPDERHRPPEEPVLYGDEIQGNVVAAFTKPNTAVAALGIDDVGKAKAWLGHVAPGVTTLAHRRTPA